MLCTNMAMFFQSISSFAYIDLFSFVHCISHCLPGMCLNPSSSLPHPTYFRFETTEKMSVLTPQSSIICKRLLHYSFVDVPKWIQSLPYDRRSYMTWQPNETMKWQAACTCGGEIVMSICCVCVQNDTSNPFFSFFVCNLCCRVLSKYFQVSSIQGRFTFIVTVFFSSYK